MFVYGLFLINILLLLLLQGWEIGNLCQKLILVIKYYQDTSCIKDLTSLCLVLCGCICQDISCIKDLMSLYEAASIEDIYLAYEQLRVDEDSLYSCIGIAGAQAGDEETGKDISF